MQEENEGEKQKADRGKYTCPPLLEQYIQFANTLPVNLITELPSQNFIEKYAFEKYAKNVDGKKFVGATELVKAYKHWLDHLPEAVKNFVFNPGEIYKYPYDEVVAIRYRMSLLLTIFEGIVGLAYAVNAAYEDDSSLFNNFPRLDTWSSLYDFQMRMSFCVDDEGFLRLRTNHFLKFIEDNNIKADRIRLCLTCEKIFWANRSDAWTCSLPCANSLRQKRWRERNKNEYNEKRRGNYAYKKSMKNKSNGDH